MKIKYNNSSTFINVEFTVLNEHVCYVIGTNVKSNSGFKAYEDDGTLLGDWSDYKYVYRILDNGIQYSNDGSQYEEPTEDVAFKVTHIETDQAFPDSINVTLQNNVGSERVIVLTKANDYELLVTNLPIFEFWHPYKADDVSGYYYVIQSNNVDYFPSQQDRIAKLEAQITYTAMMTDTLIEEE